LSFIYGFLATLFTLLSLGVEQWSGPSDNSIGLFGTVQGGVFTPFTAYGGVLTGHFLFFFPLFFKKKYRQAAAVLHCWRCGCYLSRVRRSFVASFHRYRFHVLIFFAQPGTWHWGGLPRIPLRGCLVSFALHIFCSGKRSRSPCRSPTERRTILS